jgi:hypothetical protein
MSPTGITTIYIISWQGKGYFAEIHRGNSVQTLPHPNMRCPEDLYPTYQEAITAVRDVVSTSNCIACGVEIEASTYCDKCGEASWKQQTGAALPKL